MESNFGGVTIILALFALGMIVGWLIATRESTDSIERFRYSDQKFYERWKAYCELEKRLGERHDEHSGHRSNGSTGSGRSSLCVETKGNNESGSVRSVRVETDGTD